MHPIFFFWRYQQCHMASHRYDYEPIFVYLKDKDTKPYLIVNGSLGGASCSFHKNEVRPRTGKRDRFDIYIVHTVLYVVGKNIMVRRMKAIIKQIESVVTPSGK